MLPRIEESDGIERRGNVLATMSKLKQVCNHPAQFLHDHSKIGQRSGKVERLDEILEEILAEGDRALLFTQYTEFAELLLPHISARHRRDVLYLHGGTPQKRRSEMVQQFQSEEGPPLFLLSLKAGGTGLNLTAANHVIHLDRWWNPAVEDQATDRAFRIGQGRNVQVRKFICTGTLEEKIDDMIAQKQALADLVVNDGEGWLTELSTADLREVFALSRSSVDD